MASVGRTIYSGVSALLFLLALAFLLAVANWYHETNGVIEHVAPYWKPEAQIIFFCLAQLTLFGWIYGIVVFVWRKVKLDYVDVFAVVPPAKVEWASEPGAEFDASKPLLYSKSVVLGRFPFWNWSNNRKTAHGPGRVFYISSVMSLILIWSMLIYIYFSHSTESGIEYYPSIIIPFVAFWIFMFSIVLPFIPPFWTTRLNLGAILGQVMVAIVWPFWGVKFVHVIVGDLMTSAALTLWYIEFTMCFFFSGQWYVHAAHIKDSCDVGSWHYTIMNPVMLILPFWIRFVQCLFRAWETRKAGLVWDHLSHYVNAGKYMSAILVVILSDLNTRSPTPTNSWPLMKVAWVGSLVIKTIYCAVWDIYMDWDLGHFPKAGPADDRTPLLLDEDSGTGSERAYAQPSRWFPPFLRRKRYIKQTWIYYYAIVSNFIMRASWSVALSPHLGLPPAWNLLMSLVEIVRRGQWKIFRLENEFLQMQKRRKKHALNRAMQ